MKLKKKLGGKGGYQRNLRRMKNVLAFQYFKRNKKLKELGFENYQEYLKSDIWKAIKLKIAKRQKEGVEHWCKCHGCRRRDCQLIPHHVRYKLRGTSLGSIFMVCQDCHQKIHDYHRAHPKQSLKQATRKFCKKEKKTKIKLL